MRDKFCPFKKLDFHKQVKLLNGDRKDAYISLFK